MAVAVLLFLIGTVGHNAVSAVIGVEEPFFFLVAIVVAPVLLVYGLLLALASSR